MTDVQYPKVFKQLCHMIALSRDGKLKPAIDNLVLTVFALETAATLKTGNDVAQAIVDRFGLNLSDALVQSSIDRCVSRGRLTRARESKALTLTPSARAEIQERAEQASNLERRVREEWFTAVDSKFGRENTSWKDELWACLQAYMVSAFRQHGVETTQLLDPKLPVEPDDYKNLQTYFDEAAEKHLVTINREDALEAVQQFFSDSTPSRTRYITQLLDGTFTFFALTVDKATSQYLRGNMAPTNIFLDTNFVFDILGLHANPLTDVSRELIEVIQKHNFPFTLYYHEATLSELQRTLHGLGAPLRGRNWRPGLSRVAMVQPQLNDIERMYHERNAESPLSPEVFLSQFENVPELLKEYDFKIYRTPKANGMEDTEKHELIADYKDFVESSPKARPRKYEAFDHDMTVRLTVARQRKSEASALDAGAFFLTTDFTLYRYDSRRMQRQQALGLVVLPNQLLQLLRPFVPTTDDFDRRFIEAFAIPEFRSIENNYDSTQSEIIAYLNTYSNMSEQTASRILANDLLMNQLRELPEDSEEFAEYIESALAEDNDNLLNQNSRLQETLEATEKEAETARIESQTREQQAQQAEVALTTAKREAEEAKQRETEKGEHIAQLQQQNATQVEESEALAAQVTCLHSSLKYLAALTLLAFGFLLLVVATISSWPWLEQHEHKLGLYTASVLILGVSAWAIVDGKRRYFAVATIIVGAVLALLQILDG